MNRKCTKCKLTKDLSQFYIRKSGRIVSACKNCTRKTVSKYALTENGRYVRAIAEAKFRSKKWNISKNEYAELIVQPCNYCNGFLDDNGNGIGLDRIDNSKGYFVDNVVRCCSFCNYLRGDILTLEETHALVGLLIMMRKQNIQGELNEK